MNIIQNEIRGDRATALARATLKPLLGTLFHRAAAADILALRRELDSHDEKIAAGQPVSTARQAWKQAATASATGTATPEQEKIAANFDKVGFHNWAAGRMHSLKAARAAARERLRTLLADSFDSPAPALKEKADKIEASWVAWWEKLGVPPDPCALAIELRRLADVGWQWGEGSSPLVEAGALDWLLEDSAKASGG